MYINIIYFFWKYKKPNINTIIIFYRCTHGAIDIKNAQTQFY